MRGEIEQWEVPPMPVGGFDLIAVNVPKGPKIKIALRYLFNIWKQTDLCLSKELLEHLNLDEIDKMEIPTGGNEKVKKTKQKRRHSPAKSRAEKVPELGCQTQLGLK
ncbi:hypothetical protein niasHT_037165 [Heterodera trifolii]|uniref:Uncharacterized protein n=1 Tax=Heterodera trifolii TaxID=157864 RepID=A0ABD2I7T7_9BILA